MYTLLSPGMTTQSERERQGNIDFPENKDLVIHSVLKQTLEFY